MNEIASFSARDTDTVGWNPLSGSMAFHPRYLIYVRQLLMLVYTSTTKNDCSLVIKTEENFLPHLAPCNGDVEFPLRERATQSSTNRWICWRLRSFPSVLEFVQGFWMLWKMSCKEKRARVNVFGGCWWICKEQWRFNTCQPPPHTPSMLELFCV